MINNGFNFDFSSIKKAVNNKVVFTSISRIIPYKGHLFLIELFNKILKEKRCDFTNCWRHTSLLRELS